MRRALIVLAGLLTAGCCKPITVVVPQPPPPVLVEPPLLVTKLAPSATWSEVAQAYKADLAEWVAYARKMETTIWGKPTPAPEPAKK